jgi:hypothetical protein
MMSEHTYRKVEYIQISDQQQNNYSGGQISFNLEPQKSHFSVLSDSFIAIPFQITDATDVSRYAIKNSLLSLIQGVQVRTSTGTSILNEQQGSTAIMSNLRLLIDSTLDFHDCNELQYFGCDKYFAGNAMGTTALVGGPQPTVSSATPTIDALHNQPLANRVTVFSLHAPKVQVGVSAVYTQSFLAYIPLRWVHDWFAQMDFPINNCPFELTFNVSGVTGYSQYCPVTCPTLGAHHQVGRWDAPAPFADSAATIAGTYEAAVAGAAKPTMAIAPSVTEKGYTQQGCRLFLKVVQFHDEDALKVRDLMAKGYRKELTVTTSNFFSFPRAAIGSSSDSVSSQLIGSSFIRPERVWVLPVASGTLASQANTFPSVISTGGQYLTNTNIMVNGISHYQQNLRSQYEFYKLLREQMVGSGTSLAWGTPISYEDFKCGVNPYCFDLSRHPSVESNTLCTLNLTTDIAVSSGTLPALDLIVIVEQLNTLRMDISMGGVLHSCRQGSSA